MNKSKNNQSLDKQVSYLFLLLALTSQEKTISKTANTQTLKERKQLDEQIKGINESLLRQQKAAKHHQYFPEQKMNHKKAHHQKQPTARSKRR